MNIYDGKLNIYDGKLHYLRGLNFYYSKKEFRLSFYVREIVGKKRKTTRVDMFKEQNHGRPHIHVDDHNASFAIDDGSLLCGECDNQTTKAVQEWIEKKRDTLNELWEALQKGKNSEVYKEIMERLED